MNLGSLIFSTFIFVYMQAPAFSSSLYHKTGSSKRQLYIMEGAFYGGVSQKPATLITIRHKYSATSQMDRFVVSLGDEKLNPLRGELGSYHAAIEKDPGRIVLDLNYVYQSALNESQIKNIFLASPFIKAVKAIQDPEDHSMSLVLDLKKTVALEVYEPASKTGPARLIMDLKAQK